jgi:hypothetical protein
VSFQDIAKAANFIFHPEIGIRLQSHLMQRHKPALQTLSDLLKRLVVQLPAPAQKAWVALELELLVMMDPKGASEGSVERESGSCWPLKLSSCPDVGKEQ